MQANDVAAFEAQIATLEAYARNAKKFKFYGAQVHDAEAYNLVRNHMHILKKADAELLGRHILLDQFFVTEYQILLTQAFAELSLDRQKSAYARWVEAARAVKTSAGEDQKMLKRYPWLLLNEPLDGPEGQQGPNNRTYHNNLQ